MTLSALAEQASVAKSTVSLIERGQGNPSIDTLWALAEALGVPFSSLFHDDSPSEDLTIVRGGDAEAVAVDRAGLDTEGFVGRHMLTRTGGDLIEIYSLEVDEGAVRHAAAHINGLYEHLIITAGTLEVSTEAFCETVTTGDLISFRADRPHTYRVIDGPVRFVSMHEYPKEGG